MSWLTTTEFQVWTGIVGSSDVIQHALDFTEKDIIRKLFINDQYQSGYTTSQHQILVPVMSVDGDTWITSSDIIAYETDDLQLWYDLTTSLISLDVTSGWTTFTQDVPTMGKRIVHIESWRGRDWFNRMLVELKELEKILATNKVLEDIIHKKMQGGISSWTLNGVSIDFDVPQLHAIMADNLKKVEILMLQLRVKRFDAVKMGYIQHHSGIYSPDRFAYNVHGMAFR